MGGLVVVVAYTCCWGMVVAVLLGFWIGVLVCLWGWVWLDLLCLLLFEFV